MGDLDGESMTMENAMEITFYDLGMQVGGIGQGLRAQGLRLGAFGTLGLVRASCFSCIEFRV